MTSKSNGKSSSFITVNCTCAVQDWKTWYGEQKLQRRAVFSKGSIVSLHNAKELTNSCRDDLSFILTLSFEETNEPNSQISQCTLTGVIRERCKSVRLQEWVFIYNYIHTTIILQSNLFTSCRLIDISSQPPLRVCILLLERSQGYHQQFACCKMSAMLTLLYLITVKSKLNEELTEWTDRMKDNTSESVLCILHFLPRSETQSV